MFIWGYIEMCNETRFQRSFCNDEKKGLPDFCEIPSRLYEDT